MSVAPELADALTAWVNGGSYSESFTAVRRWAPRFDRRGLEALTVTVIPGVRKSTNLTRGGTEIISNPRVTISRKVDHTDNTDGDDMMDFAEEIEARIQASSAFSLTGKTARLTSLELNLSEELMWDDGLFAAFIECEFKVY